MGLLFAVLFIVTALQFYGQFTIKEIILKAKVANTEISLPPNLFHFLLFIYNK